MEFLPRDLHEFVVHPNASVNGHVPRDVQLQLANASERACQVLEQPVIVGPPRRAVNSASVRRAAVSVERPLTPHSVCASN
jgi:hypothetical protein